MNLRTTIVSTLLVCFCVGVSGNLQAQTVSLLPEPVKLVMQSGTFRLDKDVEIVADKAIQQQSAFLAQIIQDKAKINLSVVEKAAQGKRVIRLEVVKGSVPNKEGYLLHVTSQSVTITAAAEAGVFYGIQSLRQLLPDDISAGIPCLEIEDEPQFAWRGLMLDESSLFLGKEGLFKLLDNLAELKMNVFSWHLTDIPAWRIEIKKYPELTKTTHREKITQRDLVNKKGSFYTQEDVKEVVAYAAARHITIVPEIEMPAHGDSAIGVFPWLGIAKNVGEKTPDNLISNYICDMTDPKVIEFFQNVLTEVMDLFPSKFIHIGGDEAEYYRWKDAPYIKQYMKEKGIKTPADLQVDFTNKIAQFAASKGRRVIGWNEINGANIHSSYIPNEKDEDHITELHLDPGIIVEYWCGDISFANKAIEEGNDIINGNSQHAYLDFGYKGTPLEKSYSFNPIPEGLTAAQQKKVLGVSASMWAWNCPDENAVNYQIYPRIAALAEVGWTSSDKKDYKRFLKALDYFLTEWKKQGIGYGPLTK